MRAWLRRSSAPRILLNLWVLSVFSGVLVSPVAGQFLCSAGGRDGLECLGDDDCLGGGVCVIPLGVCGGGPEVEFCSCPGAVCTAEPVCSDDSSLGTCNGGVFLELCCDMSFNCAGGAPCVSTQKLCLGGENKAFPCLTNDHCPGSSCASAGRYCAEGDFDSLACVDDRDCPDGRCLGAAPQPCVGDCNGDGVVTVDELIVGVNLALQLVPISVCSRFDTNGDQRVTIDEVVASIQVVLGGCG